jgi:hypothetical protein
VRILLLQLDGKIPNVALMRIAAHHRDAGDAVELRRCGNDAAVERAFGDSFDKVYASLIFERTRPLGERVAAVWPGATLGGTGWDVASTLEQRGITTRHQDYGVYPGFRQSVGFTQRGCRLRCSFCVVPRKEGRVTEEQTVAQLWRGEPWPRELLLLDNDFFGQPNWRSRVDEISTGGFRVSFNQGINARFLTDETAAAIASVDYRDDGMKVKRIYTAWDSRKDVGWRDASRPGSPSRSSPRIRGAAVPDAVRAHPRVALVSTLGDRWLRQGSALGGMVGRQRAAAQSADRFPANSLAAERA